MTKIYIPSPGPDAWKQFLAQPELHWAKGYSARTVANSWEAAGDLPPEIERLLEPVIGPPQLLLAIPEHKVPLPGGQRESQCDVFALVRGRDGVVACAVEGKVDEPFGPTVGEWLIGASPGKLERLRAICELLGLPQAIAGPIRYQLLHRTAAAVIEADRFMTASAAMIVQSFSPTARWRGDFDAFVHLFATPATQCSVTTVKLPSGKALYLGWAVGDQGFRLS